MRGEEITVTDQDGETRSALTSSTPSQHTGRYFKLAPIANSNQIQRHQTN